MGGASKPLLCSPLERGGAQRVPSFGASKFHPNTAIALALALVKVVVAALNALILTPAAADFAVVRVIEGAKAAADTRSDAAAVSTVVPLKCALAETQRRDLVASK